MIFVTVGTHEQPFDRLVEYVDHLKEENVIQEEIIIQTGFSTYEPKFCTFSKLYSYQEMQEIIKKARIVITHGGPSSFIAPLQIGKIPIVVPRQKEFNEHVNDHQLEFCQAISKRVKNILVAEDMEQLRNLILNYEDVVSTVSLRNFSNNAKFNEELKKIIDSIFENK